MLTPDEWLAFAEETLRERVKSMLEAGHLDTSRFYANSVKHWELEVAETKACIAKEKGEP